MAELEPWTLCLSGLDPSAHAGLLRDLWALQRLGFRGRGLPTCLSAQNKSECRSVQAVPGTYIREALATLAAEGPPAAVKVGLVAEVETWRVLGAALRTFSDAGVPLVVDPIRAPSAGGWSAGKELLEALREELLPLAPILTPNPGELAWLCGGAEPDTAVAGLLERGVQGVLLTSAERHEDRVVDAWWDETGSRELARPRHAGAEPRGTGCVLSSLLAACLGGTEDRLGAARKAGHMLWRLWPEL